MINKKTNPIYLQITFLFFLFTGYSLSDVIKDFNIEGNVRVADETIIMFSNLEIGEQISQKNLIMP